MAAGINYAYIVLNPGGGGEVVGTDIEFSGCYAASGFVSSTYKIGELIDDIGIRDTNRFIGLSKTDGGTIIDEDEYIVNSAQSNYEMFGKTYIISDCGNFSPDQDSYHLYAVYGPTPTVTAKIKGYINGTPMGVFTS